MKDQMPHRSPGSSGSSASGICSSMDMVATLPFRGMWKLVPFWSYLWGKDKTWVAVAAQGRG